MAIMTSEPETLWLIERALDQTAAVIGAVTPDQASLPTPCRDWDVHALINHLAGQDLRNFVVSARGETPDWQAPPDDVRDDWAAAFNSGAESVLAAWRIADLDRPIALPAGGQAPLRTLASRQVAELATHSWDLTKATGQPADLDPRLAEHALAWSAGMLRPEYRGPGRAFGAEVPVPPDAPAYERLAGWFGRDPAWSPAAN
jgi:uncharacterized protein (TIGR03086 family)